MAGGIGQLVSYESLTSGEKLFLLIYAALSLGFFGYMIIRHALENRRPKRSGKE